MTEYFIIYSTTESKEDAITIGRNLVESNLVACANYFPVNSIYQWKGKIEESSEYMIILKTIGENIDVVKERILEIHSYECPEIIVVKLDGGSEDYLNWINTSVKKPK